jgi:hypothetical protein
MNFLEWMGIFACSLLVIGAGVLACSLARLIGYGFYQWLRARNVAKRRGLGYQYPFMANVAAIITLSLNGYDLEIDNAIIVPYDCRKKLRKVRYPFA